VHVVSRQKWRAAPPKAGITLMNEPVAIVFIHHTLTRSGPAEDECRLVRKLQRIAFSRGFEDIGYSHLIFPTGHVYEGRGFGKVGAHTPGFDRSSYGFALVGNYEMEPMTDAQVGAIRLLIAEGQRQNFITANAAVKSHRDVSRTTCPGRKATARLSDISFCLESSTFQRSTHLSKARRYRQGPTPQRCIHVFESWTSRSYRHPTGPSRGERRNFKGPFAVSVKGSTQPRC
jgi:N-acetylmuramoyl-L-alanine amidase